MDNNNTPSLPTPHDPNSYQYSGKVMLISVVIFFSVCFLIFCFHSYTRWLFRRRAAILRRHRHHHLRRSLSPGGPKQGLDPSLLNSLPTFLYSSSHDPPLECAVCLSEFEDGESGRVLPKCNHSFHVDCISTWFHSHSNCPLCRAPVQAGTRAQSDPDPVLTIASVTEPSNSEAKSGNTSYPDSSSSFPADHGRILPELMTVTVEVPQ